MNSGALDLELPPEEAPGGDLVFYYDSDAPFFNGIVRIGEFDGEMGAVERQRDDFSVTVERAE